MPACIPFLLLHGCLGRIRSPLSIWNALAGRSQVFTVCLSSFPTSCAVDSGRWHPYPPGRQMPPVRSLLCASSCGPAPRLPWAMVWHPASQALVTFAQVHMDKALPQAWALVLPGSRADRETLFPPPSCLPTPHPYFLGWFVDPVTSHGGGLSLFPLRSYFPTKSFAHKLFSQALLFGKSRLRDPWKLPLYAWSLLSAQDQSWNEGMENTCRRLPAFPSPPAPPAPCAARTLCPRSVRASLMCRPRAGQLPTLCFILPGEPG